MPIRSGIKRAKANKKETLQKKRLFLLNIKLISRRKSAAVYADLMIKIFEKKIIKKSSGGKHCMLRTQFHTTINGHTVIYGKLAKFTKIEGDSWINIQNREVEKVEIPLDKFPNLVETDYFFIPEAHRLAILRSSKVSINSAWGFFNEAIGDVIEEGEQHSVHIVQAEGIFEEIMNAKLIQKLDIEISYTNADISEGAEAYMDRQLRQMHARKLKLSVEPDDHQTISLDSEVINGALGIARSNGDVRAVIRDENDKKKIILTSQHPEVITIEVEKTGNILTVIYEKIMELYRSIK